MRSFIKVLDWLVAGLLLILFGITFLGILMREFLNHSFTWTVDISGMMFIWLVFVGSLRLAMQDRHMKVTFLQGWLIKRFGNFWPPLIPRLFVIAFCVGGVMSAPEAIKAGSQVMMGSVPIPVSSLIYAVAASLLGIGISEIIRVVHDILVRIGVRKPDTFKISDEIESLDV